MVLELPPGIYRMSFIGSTAQSNPAAAALD